MTFHFNDRQVASVRRLSHEWIIVVNHKMGDNTIHDPITKTKEGRIVIAAETAKLIEHGDCPVDAESRALLSRVVR
jgi:hypothetical protein